VPATSKWAFYTPSLADGGAAYATTKGYDFLTTINAGEGYWVNAKVAFALSSASGQADQVANPNLLNGWNLIGNGGNLTPATFSNAIGNVTTLWAWDNPTSAWYFHAPSLAANNTLSSYILSKGYKNFGALTLGNGVGFWVNYAGTPIISGFGGVAAASAPIANGVINVVCATGSPLTTTTNSSGAWQVTLIGQVMPCAVAVSGGTISGVINTMQYHSVATSAGTVNVNPLTDLTVANLMGTATPAIWFSGLSANPAQLSSIALAQMAASLGKLSAAFSGLPLAGINNPFITLYSPLPGNALGGMLTAFSKTLLSSGVSYTALLTNASSTVFTPPTTAFNTALSTAYANTGSSTINIAPQPLIAIPPAYTEPTSIAVDLLKSGLAHFPHAMTMNSLNELFGFSFDRIYKITPQGLITELAGGGTGLSFTDGLGSAAIFSNQVGGMVADSSGNLYVSDTGNHVIRKVSPSGQVSTIAGSPGISGCQDGVYSTMNNPAALVIDANGDLIFADVGNGAIRKVQMSSTLVAKIAISGGVAQTYPVVSITGGGLGCGSGISSTAATSGVSQGMLTDSGLAIDGAGNIWVSDTSIHTVNKFSPTTGALLATVGGFVSPAALASNGMNIYVADSGNAVTGGESVSKVDVNTLAVTKLQFDCSSSVAFSQNPVGGFPVRVPKGIALGYNNQIMYISTGMEIFKAALPHYLLSTTPLNVQAGGAPITVTLTDATGSPVPSIMASTWTSSDTTMASVVDTTTGYPSTIISGAISGTYLAGTPMISLLATPVDPLLPQIKACHSVNVTTAPSPPVLPAPAPNTWCDSNVNTCATAVVSSITCTKMSYSSGNTSYSIAASGTATLFPETTSSIGFSGLYPSYSPYVGLPLGVPALASVQQVLTWDIPAGGTVPSMIIPNWYVPVSITLSPAPITVNWQIAPTPTANLNIYAMGLAIQLKPVDFQLKFLYAKPLSISFPLTCN
jgi:hypothetical protein